MLGLSSPTIVSVVSIWLHACSCIFKSVNRSNEIWHILQVWCGFWPVCANVCLLRLEAFGKVRSHIVHACGRIPWCIHLLCFSKFEFDVNDFSHNSHEYGFIPVYRNERKENRSKVENMISYLTNSYKIFWIINTMLKMLNKLYRIFYQYVYVRVLWDCTHL